MRVWVKLLLGAIAGAILGAFLPLDGSTFISRAVEWLAPLALRLGRYAAAPLVVFSLTMAICELRQEGQFWALAGKTLLVILFISIVMISAGVGLMQIFPVERIPIIAETTTEGGAVLLNEAANETLPSNMLAVLSSGSPFMFPLCVFALFMAIGLSYDKNHSKQLIAIIDSLSHVFYHIAALISEILGLSIIVLSASFFVRYRAALASGLYNNLLYLIFAVTIAFAFLILPLFLYILRRQKQRSPWSKVYGALSPAIAAFFSGDINFTLPVLFHHTKENLGVNRRINSVTVMLWTTFGRGGSAMLAAMSFIVILKSYSSMEITFAQTLQIWTRALILSFILGRNSGDGTFAAIAALCLWAPKGFETGYLILKPISFILISCGAVIDCMAASLGSYALARMSRFAPPAEKGVKNFV